MKEELKKRIKEILIGIDSDEISDELRWFETSTGAEFGAMKLKEILDLIDEVVK